MERMMRHLVRIYPIPCLQPRSSYPWPIASFATCAESVVDEPTTGPLYWEKRRAEWLKEPVEPLTPPLEDDNLPGTKARARLEQLLAEPLSEEGHTLHF